MVEPGKRHFTIRSPVEALVDFPTIHSSLHKVIHTDARRSIPFHVPRKHGNVAIERAVLHSDEVLFNIQGDRVYVARPYLKSN